MIAHSVKLGDLYAKRSPSVDPSRFPDEEFDLLSVPAHDRRAPDRVTGREIGSSKISVAPGDVLLCRIVPHIRRAWVVPEGGTRRQIASGEWIVFRDERAHPEYLRHLVLSNSFHSQFMSTVAGVGGSLLRARPAHAALIDIPLPSLPEQRRIAAILDQADELRAKRRRTLTLLEELADSIFIDMFELRRSPEWSTTSLENVSVLQGGLTVNRARSNAPIEVPYLRVANVARGRLDLGEMKQISVTNAELDRVRLIDGDLLVVEGHGNAAEVGRVARWPGSPFDTVHQNHLIRVRPRTAQVHPVYLENYLNSSASKRYFAKVSKTTSGLNTINMTNVRAVPTLVPPLSVQREYAGIVHNIEVSRGRQSAQLATIDELFASLQHRAFRGEL